MEFVEKPAEAEKEGTKKSRAQAQWTLDNEW